MRVDADQVLVIGHRGACGYRPENTLEAHELAVRLGADRVECDVVPTADGVLVVRHDADLSISTDIARRPWLAHLRRRRAARGPSGWFVEDLSLEQVTSLRAVEPLPALRPGTAVHDGRFGVPTLVDLLATIAALRAETGRDLSVAVEVKEPGVFARRGLDVAAMLEADLAAPVAAGLPVVLQCFDPRFLRRLRERGCALPLVQLLRTRRATRSCASVDDAPGTPGWPAAEEMCSDAGLREVAGYAQVLAPHKGLVAPTVPKRLGGAVRGLVTRAHDHGLGLHVFTLRDENCYLPPSMRLGTDPAAHGRAAEEYAVLAAAGVDGVFTDHPDTAVLATRALHAGEESSRRRARTAAVG